MHKILYRPLTHVQQRCPLMFGVRVFIQLIRIMTPKELVEIRTYCLGCAKSL